MSEQKQENRVVLVEGKLTKIIHAQGTGETPKKGQQIHALYRGTLQTGEQFDANQDRDSPFSFTLGEGRVIKGWDEGFASMKKGQKATLICSPEYAYGARGSPPRIPPNSTLHFEVELIDFNDKKKEKWDLNEEEKVQEATRLKNQGNQDLKNGQFASATKKYEEGITFVEDETGESAKAILKTLRMNASQANLKLKHYSKAIQLCTKVLKDDADNAKTLYRRGVSYLNNQEFENAKTDLQRLLVVDPSNEDAKNELAKVAAAKKAAEQKQKKLFGSMFSKSGLYDDVKPQTKKEPVNKEESDSDEMPGLQKAQQVQAKSQQQQSTQQSQQPQQQ